MTSLEASSNFLRDDHSKMVILLCGLWSSGDKKLLHNRKCLPVKWVTRGWRTFISVSTIIFSWSGVSASFGPRLVAAVELVGLDCSWKWQWNVNSGMQREWAPVQSVASCFCTAINACGFRRPRRVERFFAVPILRGVLGLKWGSWTRLRGVEQGGPSTWEIVWRGNIYICARLSLKRRILGGYGKPRLFAFIGSLETGLSNVHRYSECGAQGHV